MLLQLELLTIVFVPTFPSKERKQPKYAHSYNQLIEFKKFVLNQILLLGEGLKTQKHSDRRY